MTLIFRLRRRKILLTNKKHENEKFRHLGPVVTNNGYSDWAATETDPSIKSVWYRFSRQEDDYCIECSDDGVTFKRLRFFTFGGSFCILRRFPLFIA